MFVITGYANQDYTQFGTAYAPWSTIQAMASQVLQSRFSVRLFRSWLSVM